MKILMFELTRILFTLEARNQESGARIPVRQIDSVTSASCLRLADLGFFWHTAWVTADWKVGRLLNANAILTPGV